MKTKSSSAIIIIIILVVLIYFLYPKEEIKITDKSNIHVKYLDKDGNVVEEFAVPFERQPQLMATIIPAIEVPRPITSDVASVVITVNVYNDGTVPVDISVLDYYYEGEFYI